MINDCKAYFLTGCTATGKSALAHYLACQMQAAILSADSMLVYQGMDIGTAKPSLAERSEIPYAGIDLVKAGESCNLYVFFKAASAAAAAAVARQQTLIVVGGTGLYLLALLRGFDHNPPPDSSWRQEAEDILKLKGVSALAEHLKKIDPDSYARLPDPLNPRRLIRAIEISRASARNNLKFPHTLANIKSIPGLNLPPEELEESIRNRVDKMFEQGLPAEARSLFAEGFSPDSTAWQAIGYAESLAYLRGELSENEAKERVVIRTRRLAKKQRTWFRHKLDVDWIDINLSMSLPERAALVRDYWEKHGPNKIFCQNR